MKLTGTEREELETLSELFLGSKNKAAQMIKKGVTVPVLDENNKQKTYGKSNSPMFEVKYYTEKDLLDRLRNLQGIQKQLEATKAVEGLAQGSTKQ